MKVETLVDRKSKLGEGPLWHTGDNKLYWVDIVDGIVNRYDPATNVNEEVYRDEPIGGFTIQVDGSLLLFMQDGAIRLWEAGNVTTLVEHVPELIGTRFNDVIADPVGRVFCGTMPDATGRAYLYRLNTDGNLNIVLDSVGLSNGMGFSPDKSLMYHVDSANHLVGAYDYRASDGSLNNRRVFLNFEETRLVPDGLTVDAQGYLWIAFWDGGCVRRFTPAGEEVLKIDLPAKKTTSMTFAGDDYMDLYITSAGGDHRSENGALAGSLFRIVTGIKGLPEHRSAIRVQ